jgi:hypothetical protein
MHYLCQPSSKIILSSTYLGLESVLRGQCIVLGGGGRIGEGQSKSKDCSLGIKMSNMLVPNIRTATKSYGVVNFGSECITSLSCGNFSRLKVEAIPSPHIQKIDIVPPSRISLAQIHNLSTYPRFAL